jgi:hypothetical protein
MKKFLVVFVSLVTFLAFFSFMVSLPNRSALAIDRSPKKSEAKEKEKPAEFKELERIGGKEGKTNETISSEKKGETKTRGTVPQTQAKGLQSAEKQKPKEKYDYFIDKNNNGIDDRLERKSKESVSPPAVRPVPKDKQPTKSAPSVRETDKKTDKKKEIKEVPKKKEVKEAKKIEGKKGR